MSEAPVKQNINSFTIRCLTVLVLSSLHCPDWSLWGFPSLHAQKHLPCHFSPEKPFTSWLTNKLTSSCLILLLVTFWITIVARVAGKLRSQSQEVQTGMCQVSSDHEVMTAVVSFKYIVDLIWHLNPVFSYVGSD